MENVETENTIADILTPKQERFCFNFTQNQELFGNATLSYAEAYGYDLDGMPDDDTEYTFKDGSILTKKEIDAYWDEKEFKDKGEYKKTKESTRKRNYDLCSQYGSRLRRNEKIQKRSRELLNQFMNDEVIDSRLTEIIISGEDSDSLRAISEYNKLKQRIVERKDIKQTGTLSLTFDEAFNETPRQTEDNSSLT